MNALAVVGYSDSGKTTLIEGLVAELCRRGYRIGTVKHDAHSFEIDHEGKDSWRHRYAGAQVVVIASRQGLATIETRSREPELAEILSRFEAVDLVIVEGFKKSALPKIVMHRPSQSCGLVCAQDPQVFAVVSDGWVDSATPVFRPQDVTAVADLVELRFLRPGLHLQSANPACSSLRPDMPRHFAHDIE